MGNWHYYYRRYLGWIPIQFCMVCGKVYWGGFPRWGTWKGKFQCIWQAWMQDFCSRKCADEELENYAAAHFDMYPDDPNFDGDQDFMEYSDDPRDYDDEEDERGYN